MPAFVPTLQDLSTCLRCQYRIAASKKLRIVSPHVARHVAELRLFTSGQTRRQSQTQHDTVSNIQYPSKRVPIRYMDHHERFKRGILGLDVLGKPAEVLILRDDQEDTSYQSERLLPNPNTTSSSELLDEINGERGIPDSDQVRQHLDNIKATWFSKIQRESGRLTAEECNEIVLEIYKGFTEKQLLDYVNHGDFDYATGPVEFEASFSTNLYTRSLWFNGVTPFPGDSLSRLRSEVLGNLWFYEEAGSDIPRFSKKTSLINKVMRQCWHIRTQEEVESIGELDVLLQVEHIDLLLTHRSTILTRLAERYDAKIDIYQSQRIIRLTADYATCRDLFILVVHVLENMRSEEIDLATIQSLDRGTTSWIAAMNERSLLKQMETFTSTVIRPVNEQSVQGSSSSKLRVYYLGPEDDDLEDVRRLITQAVEPSTLRETHIWKGASSSPPVLTPVEVGRGVPWIDRMAQWSRWRSTSDIVHGLGTRREGSESESLAPFGSQRHKLLATSAISKFLGTGIPETSRSKASSTAIESSWQNDVESQISAKFGLILHSASAVQSQVSGTYEKFETIKGSNGRELASQRVILTNIPGSLQLLQLEKAKDIQQREEIHVRLIPSAIENVHVFPDIDLCIAIDPVKKTSQLDSIRLIIRETESDILLPEHRADVRFNVESYLTGSPQLDPRIQDFVQSSNFNIWGTERLKTPPRLKVVIPEHALKTFHALPTVPSNGALIDYTFAGLDYRSQIQVPYDAYNLQYTTIEAGKAGGRRTELCLRWKFFPKCMPFNYLTPKPDFREDVFPSLMNVAYNLVGRLTAFGAEFKELDSMAKFKGIRRMKVNSYGA